MKNLKLMSMLLGGLLALGSLSSCGSDNDDEEPLPEVMKPTSATAEYVVTLGQGLLDVANVTIYYIDSKGEQAQETVTSTNWTKTVNFATLPAKTGFSVQPVLKGQPSQEEYTIVASGQIKITVLDQKGGTFGTPYVSNLKELKGLLGPDFIGQFMTRISTRLMESKAISADGSIADTAITWGGNADNDDPNRDTSISTEGATGETR